MRALSSPLRNRLETAVLAARRAAESASRAAIDGLGVYVRDKPAHLDADQAGLRNGLRAKWRQLGGGDAAQPLLIAECAYEQWHRLLFARFLAENDLLLHPQYKAPVSLAECDELAAQMGEPDGWSVAARLAAEILPGIFRVDDPCVRLRLAPEGRHALEEILEGLPAGVFATDDALGWVYQFWQKDKKDEVNKSERKIGGADLGPVTQLFTENYMVRFLLENSLGAWWAARHPDSPLVRGFEYLRFDDDGKPAAGSFDGWPERVAEVTVMDPCCGSGHFLVEAFSMLWQMRSEEEGLIPVEAQNAVLRDNLFGLELDARCVQIAMFAVALQAWKACGGWRQLPVPNIACSGIPVKAPIEEWKALAGGDERLEKALVRLHILFRDADTLGSLIDPKRAAEIADPSGLQTSLEDVDWEVIAPLIAGAMAQESREPATAVLGEHAAGVGRAARYLSRSYVLVTTNVPYLGRSRQSPKLASYLERSYPEGRADLATCFLERCRQLFTHGGSIAMVCQDTYLFLKTYAALRKKYLLGLDWHFIVDLGPGAFREITGEVVRGTLLIQSTRMKTRDRHPIAALNVADLPYTEKQASLRSAPVSLLDQKEQLQNPDHRVTFSAGGGGGPLGNFAHSYQGLSPADTSRFVRSHWEFPFIPRGVRRLQSRSSATASFTGRNLVLILESVSVG